MDKKLFKFLEIELIDLVELSFKVELSPSKKTVLFASMKALWNWREMFFISS